jgi:hypothetical protein
MTTDQDHFEAMYDQSLLRHLQIAAARREEQLAVREIHGEWVAETLSSGGLAGRTAVFRGIGVDRRTAMMELARRLADSA